MTLIPDAVSAQGLDGCLDEGCGAPIVGRGRCQKHYMRWWRASRTRERAPALNLRSLTPAQRFWQKIERHGPEECWPWTGSTMNGGHGEFFVSPDRGRIPAHVFALELAGKSATAGQEGCHHCDNPPCCNPAHLYFGTRQQNIDDMWARGRGRRGSRHPFARLTEDKVKDLRVRFAEGESNTVLAQEYGICSGMVSNIVNGKAWKHVDGPVGTHGRPGRRPKLRTGE